MQGFERLMMMKYTWRKRLFFMILFVMVIGPGGIEIAFGKATAERGWFPFAIPWDDSSENIINVSKVVLDAPAGKHGFLQVKQGHFYFHDGTRIRFWGANLTMAANFPTHEEAEKLAAHLAKYGFNMIRLHHMDSNYAPTGIFNKKNQDTSLLDDQQLERLDYLIFQLKQHGIYVDMNLHVGRRFTEADGVVASGNIPINSKVATLFDTRLIDLQKDYAKKLLTHFNPYTKTRYCNEPGMALVETTNENSLFPAWNNGVLFGKTVEGLPNYYIQELDRKWRDWLKRKYGNNAKLKETWAKGVSTPGPNLVRNSGFESDLSDAWVQEIHQGIKAHFVIDSVGKVEGNNAVRLDIEQGGVQNSQLQLKQNGIKLLEGKNYTLSFYAKTDLPQQISVSFGKETAPWTNYGLYQIIDLNKEWNRYRVSFIAKAGAGIDTRLAFVLGKTNGHIWLDNVTLTETGIIGLEDNESLMKDNVSRTLWSERYLYTAQRVADNTEFYCWLEKEYFTQMNNYIHRELAVKVPVSTTNNYFCQPDLAAQNVGDYIDTHAYWDHPRFPGKPFDSSSFIQHNESLIANQGFVSKSDNNNSPIVRFSLSAIAEKPLVVSEWNDVFPNDYEYEEAGTLAAYGLLQDWDGLFIYTLAHEPEDFNSGSINSWFNVINNPGKMAQMPSLAVLFIRGDLQKAQKELQLDYTSQDVFSLYRDQVGAVNYNIQGNLPLEVVYTYQIRKRDFKAAKTTKIGDLLGQTELAKLISEKNYRSDTGEIYWNGEQEGAEYVSWNTKRFQGVAGFLTGQNIILRDLQLQLQTASSAFLVAMDGRDISDSRKMLLTLTARQQNTGQVKGTANGLINWGHSPILMEQVHGVITIRNVDNNLKYKVFSIDGKGERINQIPLLLQDRLLSFQVGNEASPWYEIIKEF
jgi:hypothetical protein